MNIGIEKNNKARGMTKCPWLYYLNKYSYAHTKTMHIETVTKKNAKASKGLEMIARDRVRLVVARTFVVERICSW